MIRTLQTRLHDRLAQLLPRHLVQVSMAPDGIGTIAIKTMSSDESWTITGLNIQSLMGKGAMEDVVDEILLEVFSLNDGPPMHSLNIAKKA